MLFRSHVNALPFKCHSIKFDRDHQTLFDTLVQTHQPGEVIDMPVPPICILVEIFPPAELREEVLNALRSFSIEKPTIGRTRSSKQTGRIVIPIYPSKSIDWDSSPTLIRGSDCFLPSRAVFRNLFPLELAFAITVHKSQGRTLERVIIALSGSQLHNCRFSFQQLLVAFSRVEKGDDIRLLLVGETEEQMWESITYINNLVRDPAVAFFFAGFREPSSLDINHNWTHDDWNQDRANMRFEAMIDKGFFPRHTNN